MNDITLLQVNRMRAWIVQCYDEHRAYCCLCRNWISCAELERLFTLHCRWSSRFVDMQWQEVGREEEGV